MPINSVTFFKPQNTLKPTISCATIRLTKYHTLIYYAFNIIISKIKACLITKIDVKLNGIQV